MKWLYSSELTMLFLLFLIHSLWKFPPPPHLFDNIKINFVYSNYDIRLINNSLCFMLLHQLAILFIQVQFLTHGNDRIIYLWLCTRLCWSFFFFLCNLSLLFLSFNLKKRVVNFHHGNKNNIFFLLHATWRHCLLKYWWNG